MKRYPNPWFAIPTLLGTVVGAGLGWAVTAASCRPATCHGWATVAAVTSGLIAMAGVATVLVLAFRSIEEFNTAARAGQPESGPECEVPDGDV